MHMHISAVHCTYCAVPHIFKWLICLCKVFRNAIMKMLQTQSHTVLLFAPHQGINHSMHFEQDLDQVKSVAELTYTLWCPLTKKILGFLLSFSTYHISLPASHSPPHTPPVLSALWKEKCLSQDSAEPQFLSYESREKSDRNTTLITNRESRLTRIIQPDPYITQARKLSVRFLQYLRLSQKKKNDTLQSGIMDQ